MFDADTTTMAERKQLLRAVLSEVTLTVDQDTKQATARVCFEGGAAIERIIAPSRHGNRIRATDEDTIELVRRLACHYNDTRIAQILSRQARTTATGLSFTCQRVNALRQDHGIPAGPRSTTAEKDDAATMTLGDAQRALGVSGVTLYRWLRQGFIAGTQLTPGGPWHIRVDDELRAKIVPELPPGWVTLKQAATSLGVAHQTVLDRVRRGELEAVHLKRGLRSGLAIDIGTRQHNQRDRLFN